MHQMIVSTFNNVYNLCKQQFYINKHRQKEILSIDNDRNLYQQHLKLIIDQQQHPFILQIHKLDLLQPERNLIKQFLQIENSLASKKQYFFYDFLIIISLMQGQNQTLSDLHVEQTQKYEQQVMFEDSLLHEVQEEHMDQKMHRFITAIVWMNQNVTGRGSGMLISRDLVLTCAHNCFHKQKMVQIEQLKIYVGACGQLKRSYNVQNIYIPQKYTNMNMSRNYFDYALIKLKEKVQFNDYIPLSANFKQPSCQLAIYGYPASAYRMTRRQSQVVQKVYQRGLIKKNSTIKIDEKRKIIEHCISTQAGHAGSPMILVQNQTDLYVIGIHKGAFRKKQQHSNLGILITPQLIKQLQKQAIAMNAQPFKIQQSSYTKYIRLAQEQLAKNKYQQAIKKYRQLLKTYPNSYTIHYNLGFALKEQYMYIEAIQSFRKVVDLNPSFAQAYNNLGNSYKLTNSLEEAIFCYRKILQINPNDPSAYYNLGIVLSAKGKIQEAIDCYKSALKNDASFYAAQNNLGRLLSQMGRNQEAKKCYERALELNPFDDQVYNNLGVTYKELDNFQLAIQCFQKAVQLNKKNITALANLQKTCTLKTFQKKEQSSKQRFQIKNHPKNKQSEIQEYQQKETRKRLKKLCLAQSQQKSIIQLNQAKQTFEKKQQQAP